jgi:hypothetical protein
VGEIISVTMLNIKNIPKLNRIMFLWSIQDVHGADFKKHWPGSDMILVSYWSRAGEVPVSAVHAMYFASCFTTVSVIALNSY